MNYSVAEVAVGWTLLVVVSWLTSMIYSSLFTPFLIMSLLPLQMVALTFLLKRVAFDFLVLWVRRRWYMQCCCSLESAIIFFFAKEFLPNIQFFQSNYDGWSCEHMRSLTHRRVHIDVVEAARACSWPQPSRYAILPWLSHLSPGAKPFPYSWGNEHRPTELVQSDLCDLLSPSWDENRYMLVLVEQHTRFIYAYVLETKGVTSTTIHQGFQYGQRLTSTSLKFFECAWEGESQIPTILFQWIIHETSIPEIPYGVAEHSNPTLLT